MPACFAIVLRAEVDIKICCSVRLKYLSSSCRRESRLENISNDFACVLHYGPDGSSTNSEITILVYVKVYPIAKYLTLLQKTNFQQKLSYIETKKCNLIMKANEMHYFSNLFDLNTVYRQ